MAAAKGVALLGGVGGSSGEGNRVTKSEGARGACSGKLEVPQAARGNELIAVATCSRSAKKGRRGGGLVGDVA